MLHAQTLTLPKKIAAVTETHENGYFIIQIRIPDHEQAQKTRLLEQIPMILNLQESCSTTNTGEELHNMLETFSTEDTSTQLLVLQSSLIKYGLTTNQKILLNSLEKEIAARLQRYISDHYPIIGFLAENTSLFQRTHAQLAKEAKEYINKNTGNPQAQFEKLFELRNNLIELRSFDLLNIVDELLLSAYKMLCKMQTSTHTEQHYSGQFFEPVKLSPPSTATSSSAKEGQISP